MKKKQPSENVHIFDFVRFGCYQTIRICNLNIGNTNDIFENIEFLLVCRWSVV